MGTLSSAMRSKFVSSSWFVNVQQKMGKDWWFWLLPTTPQLPDKDGTFTAAAATATRLTLCRGTMDPSSPLCTLLRSNPSFDRRIIREIVEVCVCGAVDMSVDDKSSTSTTVLHPDPTSKH